VTIDTSSGFEERASSQVVYRTNCDESLEVRDCWRFCSRDNQSDVKEPIPLSMFTELAPSYFSMFGTVSNRLEQVLTLNGENCVEQLGQSLKSISPEELERVSAAWVERTRQVSQRHRDYMEAQSSDEMSFSS
jgi:hypothetical protein